MKEIKPTVVCVILAFIVFKFYNHVTDWKFFVAFIGGAINAFIFSSMVEK